jgi:hypothetical protein
LRGFGAQFVRELILWALEPKSEVVYKRLPPNYNTHVLVASPFGPGLPTFSSSPGEPVKHLPLP